MPELNSERNIYERMDSFVKKIDKPRDWSMGRSVDRSVGRSVGWFVGWLVDWLIGWLIG
ncbi:unnamed protein product [Wuchereria bancrofti]|uniref:Uncharacterized protein n=1 Tax=Wuchereria bancrofti TaxID=6293 RepID=A0A3P7DXL0_WUCBA|nr:unnamed protein product [Wuchereria bancrofti]